MTNPIERVYVIENNLEGPMQASGFDVNPERAERFREAIKGVTRVFVEEARWVTDRAPDNGRTVLALFTRNHIHSKPQVIIAFFGSEGKWCAEDHNGRVTYLDNALVHGWRELPGAMGPLQIGLTVATGWR